MSLLDSRGRPIGEVPIDEARVGALVKSRCEAWRTEPMGIPRAPDLEFFRARLGTLTPAMREAIARLWQVERRRGRGGAHGVTTLDRLPDDDPQARFDRAYTRMMGRTRR